MAEPICNQYTEQWSTEISSEVKHRARVEKVPLVKPESKAFNRVVILLCLQAKKKKNLELTAESSLRYKVQPGLQILKG